MVAVVELKNMSKIYDNKLKVVCHVNFTINDKEFVVLVCLSGCGKSTTHIYWSIRVDNKK